jgi:hypothetical protein
MDETQDPDIALRRRALSAYVVTRDAGEGDDDVLPTEVGSVTVERHQVEPVKGVEGDTGERAYVVLRGHGGELLVAYRVRRYDGALKRVRRIPPELRTA